MKELGVAVSDAFTEVKNSERGKADVRAESQFSFEASFISKHDPNTTDCAIKDGEKK